MHDVAKPAPPAVQQRSFVRSVIAVLLPILLLFGLVAGLKTAGVAVVMMLTIVFAAVAIASAVFGYRRFRGNQTIRGALWAVLCLFCVLTGIKVSQIGKMMSTPFAMPPTAVSSAVVQEEDWSPKLYSVGSISPVQGAVVAAELGGVVSQVQFQNGGEAKKGDVLIKLDTSSEEAQLRTAEAELELARANLDRARELSARKVVSKSELDAADSAAKQKQGAVENMHSLMSKKEVHAPFDGQLGIRQVNIGQMITAGQPVVALTSLDPVYIDFALPQQELSKLSTNLEVQVQTDAVPGRIFKGQLTAINSMVDAVTRNVPLQATLENHDRTLRPGMFARAEVLLPEKKKTLVIPGSAVSYAPYGDSVYVIEKSKDPKTGKEGQTIRQQVVRVGESRGDFVSITDGLKPGQTIVSTGVFKLRNGMTVTINNDLAPKPQLNPTPVDS